MYVLEKLHKTPYSLFEKYITCEILNVTPPMVLFYVETIKHS